jgi:predicted tellurium resistance membrane protein TerC
MMKFKIYRAIAVLFSLLTLLVSFSPVRTSEQWNEARTLATMLLVILFFVCYSLLLSVLNYYKEAGWKNVAVIIFLSGNSVFYFLSLSHSMPNLFFNFFI